MTPSYLVIHDSNSKYGNPYMVETWHQARGFSWHHVESDTFIHTGYHYLILNGHLYSKEEKVPEFDGMIVPARPENVSGAHCIAQGRNGDSLGICAIGPPFSAKQFSSLVDLCLRLMRKYHIPATQIVAHKEMDTGKEDPRFDVKILRTYLMQNMEE